MRFPVYLALNDGITTYNRKLLIRFDLSSHSIELVCCQKQQKKFLTSYWFAELKDLNDSKLFVCESSIVSSRINFIPFISFRGTIFYKPVTGQEPFFAVSYSKPALAFFCSHFRGKYGTKSFLAKNNYLGVGS